MIENNVEYGHIESCIKVAGSSDTGCRSTVWPAFWMLGSNIDSVGWPTCGEIDIMETKGSQEGREARRPLTMARPHARTSAPGGQYTFPVGQYMYSGYHIYSVDSVAEQIVWSVDGHPYYTATPQSEGRHLGIQQSSLLSDLRRRQGGAFGGSGASPIR